MKYDLEEAIMAAMMNHELLVIVEGQDDIKFYSNIAEKNGICADVKAVETIEGYSEGCEKVIEAMTEANGIITSDKRLKKHVMGVIDRDARRYRNTLPSLSNLLVLKYYSYETHLINNHSIASALTLLTRVPSNMVLDKVIEYVKEKYDDEYGELFYFSLEALKNACTIDYNASITYADDCGKLTGEGKKYYWSLISEKQDELDSFANEHHLSKNDIKRICKGKWYLGTWCDFLLHLTDSLYLECGNRLPGCIYCASGNKEKCLWRKKVKYQVPELEAHLIELPLPGDEIDYIVLFMKSIISDQNIEKKFYRKHCYLGAHLQIVR